MPFCQLPMPQGLSVFVFLSRLEGGILGQSLSRRLPFRSVNPNSLGYRWLQGKSNMVQVQEGEIRANHWTATRNRFCAQGERHDQPDGEGFFGRPIRCE